MRSGVLSAVALTIVVFAGPATALQTVILPQPPGDSATNAQVPSDPSQDPFATDQNNNKGSPLGSFHFNMSSGQDWPGDPYHMYRPQNPSPDAYGNAATPGSEFSTSNLFNPH